MASTTVLDPPADHQILRLESLPLIDLNLLSQTELFSLSLCSSSSSHPHRRCDDDVLIPKIDRSVFNESAGSRKQTYSRLRLAPRNSQLASSTTITRQTPLEPLDQENVQIIGLLKQLFASGTHDDLVPVRIDYNDNDSVLQPFSNVMQTIPIDVVFDIAQKKRKRGRPRKDANLAVENHSEKKKNDGNGSFRREIPIEPVSSDSLFFDAPRDIIGGGVPTKRKRGRPRKVEKRAVQSSTAGSVEVKEELVLVNINGGVVDLVALGNMEDPFGEELRKTTEGLETEVELLGFLEGLEGEWVTNKKKKIVQANKFGDALPRDWKIMLSIERKEGRVYLFCRRYIRFLLTLAIISICP